MSYAFIHNLMKSIYNILTLLFLLIPNLSLQAQETDAHIIGHVVCAECEKHIPFATIGIEGTTIGTTTDETGHYRLINLPPGTYTLKANFMGHKPGLHTVTVKRGQTVEVNFDLPRDVLGLEEVTITGDRNETNRKDASTIVNIASKELFNTTQSVTLGEGLNFVPGLRLENNCQNCGFSQVRMNGMEGPYSQVLINSRPIFSGLAGVYGLELIPANMIQRVEVIRGSGSALYGSNAVAGTINVILEDPVNNAYEFGASSGLVGAAAGQDADPAADHSLNFNSSLVSSDSKTGMSFFGFHRNREPFDANGDSFSELSSIKNTTIGSRIYHRFSTRSKLSLDFFQIREDRRGGDRFDRLYHEANIAEAVNHDITTGALTFEQFFRGTDLFSAYLSAQRVKRDSYYGANQSLSDYGLTKDLSYTAGIQYNARFSQSGFTVGLENIGTRLHDQKLGYPDYENAVIENGAIIAIPHTQNTTVVNQTTRTTGMFGQYEITWDKLTASAGARYDHYFIGGNGETTSSKSGNVFSPRLSLKYDLLEYLQARVSYSQGYRAPQVFDEDLHIETSGSRQVIHVNDPDLTQEHSHSYMASLDFNRSLGSTSVGLLVEGFHTRLNDPFANEFSEPDENGVVTYTRVNAEGGAQVSGLNTELNMVPAKNFNMTAGFTFQESRYDEKQEFGEKRFFRTPGNYGFITADWNIAEQAGISSTGTYTGKMLVPYFGPLAIDPDAGELRETSPFFDLGMKAHYQVKINGASMQLFAGVKNIFNSYQSDFDSGIDRDPGYIYGPMSPRTVYAGIKIGNMLRR